MSGIDLPVETPLTSASVLLNSVLAQLDTSKPISSGQLTQLRLVADLLGGLDRYLDTVSSEAPAVQRPLLKATAEHDWDGAFEQGKTMFHLGAHWSAGAYEGNLVGLLTKLTRARTALEIGMFTGTTTVCIAAALPQDGKVTAMEIDPYLDTFTRPLFEQTGLADKIDVRIGDARNTLHQLATEKQQYDIIFIDADKTGYAGYFDAIFDRDLLAPNGLLVVDNTLYKGSPWSKRDLLHQPELSIAADNADAIKDFNVMVSKDARVEVVVLPVRDGVSLIMRK